MKKQVESLLEDDHASLGQLLTELDVELAKPNLAHAFKLLDLCKSRPQAPLLISPNHMHQYLPGWQPSKSC